MRAPRSPTLLLEAARAHKRDDRLTDLLAVVLAGHQGFARSLMRRARVEVPNTVTVEMTTQVRTERGKFVDVTLVALARGWTVVGRVWSEHKTGSAYSLGQLPGCAEELEAS